MYRGHQLYISVFMFFFYINVKSQVSLSPNNILPGSLGLSGRCRDQILYQQLSISHAPYICVLFYFHCDSVSLPCSVVALWKRGLVLSVK